MDKDGFRQLREVTRGRYTVSPEPDHGEDIRYLSIARRNMDFKRLLNLLNEHGFMETSGVTMPESPSRPVLKSLHALRGNETHPCEIIFADLNSPQVE